MDSPKVLRNILTNIFPKCLTAKIILIVTIKIVTRRIFNRLINKKIISLDRLVRMRFSLGKLLIEKIDALIDEACKKTEQTAQNILDVRKKYQGATCQNKFTNFLPDTLRKKIRSELYRLNLRNRAGVCCANSTRFEQSFQCSCNAVASPKFFLPFRRTL